MGDLSAKARKKLPAKKFGEPKKRKYPMEDKKHAGLAKAYAKKEVAKGNLSVSAEKKIDRKANKVLKKKSK